MDEQKAYKIFMEGLFFGKGENVSSDAVVIFTERSTLDEDGIKERLAEICSTFGVPAGREVSVDRIIWHMKDVLSKKTDVDALTFHCEIGYGDLVSIATTIKKALESGGI